MSPKSTTTAIVKVQTDAILAPILTAELVEGLDAKAAKAEQIKALVAAFKISNDDEEQKAALYLTRIHADLKAAEEERKVIADPLTKAKKALDARYKQTTDPLTTAKEVLARVLGDYRVEKARKQALLVAKSTEEAATPEERRALIVAGTEEAPKLSGLREVVSYVVTCTAPAEVERAFLVPDVDKALEVVRASEGKVVPRGFSVERITKMVPTGR